ncbi:MAG TPA: MotA/TolQ/ExbB proton channel family protein [Polyangiaceae bacterium]|nr:MotA/TolQ/ExbB proton channel family protein [Polyangiaceae bacterium]
MALECWILALAGVTINLAAAWQLLRARGETSPARLRPIGHRVRALAVIALFLGFIAPVVGVVLAFQRVGSVAVERRAIAMAEGISQAMNSALLGFALALPSLIIAIYLMQRTRAAQRQNVRS